MIVAFWIIFSLLFYTYFGYGIVLKLLIVLRPRRMMKRSSLELSFRSELPTLALIVAAYNEEECIEAKIKNSLALEYPPEKLEYIFVTDGSTDRTPEIVLEHHEIKLLHQEERAGKQAAIERAIHTTEAEVVVLTDANALLNSQALLEIGPHFTNPEVGAVAGEKRVINASGDGPNGAGESMYWRYESWLKQLDNDYYSVVGAAGELFALRTELFMPLPPETLIEDFVQSMRICKRGFIVKYEPDAFAMEAPSANLAEEFKRKVRIAAGGLQAITQLPELLDIFTYNKLSFQYVSHRVLRWTMAPLLLPIFLIVHIVTGILFGGFYLSSMWAHIAFYLMGIAGFFLDKKGIKLKLFYLPLYFMMMNIAVYVGFFRLRKGEMKPTWEKVERAEMLSEEYVEEAALSSENS